jgi:predicted permease
MEAFLQDLKYAVRMLWKKPGFTLIAVLSLTLGIGANSTVFTLAKAVFLQSVPVKDPSRVMMVYSWSQQKGLPRAEYLPVTQPNGRDYREKSTSFSSATVMIPTGLNMVVDGKDIGLFCILATYDFFDVMGIEPARGRAFTAEEDRSEHPVVVISNALWNRQFGADKNILNRTVRLGTETYTIIGVMPDFFHDLGQLGSPDLLIPMAMHDRVLTGLQKDWFNRRGARMAFMAGRLKPGVSFKQAEGEITNLASELQRQFPTDNAGRGAMLMPIADTVIPPRQRSDFVRAGTLMGVIVGLVLLIACANVANLLLARATQRQREIAVRQSMGARRWRLVRQLLTESFLLALIAGILGSITAIWTRSLIHALLPPGTLPNNLDLNVDWKVVLFTFLLSLAATMLFGLMPALESSRSDRLASLRDRTDAPTGSTRWYGLRGALVMVQVALSLVALVGAGLFIHSLRNAQDIDTGFEVKRELTVPLNLAPDRYPQPRAEQFYRDAIERVKALPNIADAGITDHPPFGGTILRTAFTEGTDINDPRNGKATPLSNTLPGYFSAAGMTLVRGRDFTDHDDTTAPMVCIVNQAAAQQFWPNQDAMSKRLRFLLTDWNVEVVGIVNTVKFQTLGETPQPIIYMPLKQHFLVGGWMWARTKTDPNAAAPMVRDAIQSLDPQLRLNNLRPVSFFLDQSLAAPRLGAELLGGFGMLALLLAAMGTYGVMSYSVNQRTQEIGIRMAMGAQRTDVLKLIVGNGMAMVVVGIVAGMLLASLMTKTIAALLYGIGWFDAPSFLGTAALLIAVALLACLIPARRASRVDPMVALRYE